MSLHDLLTEARELDASDLHLTSHSPPIVRIDGELRALPMPPMRPTETRALIWSVLNDSQKVEFEQKWELDFSIQLKDVGRFRVNVHKQRGAIEAAFRLVSDVILPLEKLGIPPSVEKLARYQSGLALITGPTGSGKTTTMAALLDLINRERSCMVVTIEDPIEYVHRNQNSIVKQREVHADTHSFGDGLRHVLRQDPDVIAIGEMRDQETIATALTAAETGHLVLATLHTTDVAQTIDRVIDVFPPHQQTQVRYQFAATLQGIVAQCLLPRKGGKGRVPACEILIATTAARRLIRDSQTEQITTLLQTGYDSGMITMDRSLKELYDRELIDRDTAMKKAKYPDDFDQL